MPNIILTRLLNHGMDIPAWVDRIYAWSLGALHPYQWRMNWNVLEGVKSNKYPQCAPRLISQAFQRTEGSPSSGEVPGLSHWAWMYLNLSDFVLPLPQWIKTVRRTDNQTAAIKSHKEIHRWWYVLFFRLLISCLSLRSPGCMDVWIVLNCVLWVMQWRCPNLYINYRRRWSPSISKTLI